MKRTNRKYIDKLFKEGLNPEKDAFPFRDSEWTALKQRLDQYEKRKKAIFLLRALSGIAALYLLILFWLSIGSKQQASPIQQMAKQRNTQKTEQPINLPSSRKTVKPNSNAGSNPHSSPSLAFNRPFKKRTSKKFLKEALKDKPIPGFDTTSLASQKVLELLHEPLIIPERQIAYLQIDTIKFNSPPKSRPAGSSHLMNEPRHRNLTLSILVAPSINGVNNLNMGKVGSDAGLLLTMGLTKRWSISTGAVYGKKLYQTGFNNYNPINNMPFIYTPQKVDADCRVLDIPINFNYAFIKKGNNTFSLGTGISSYLMLNEDYNFIYNNPVSTDLKEIQVVNKNRHWLSIVNFQATYERRLNSKFGISLQPYLKIPLNDIGFARVKLQTLSMAVNFNWYLK